MEDTKKKIVVLEGSPRKYGSSDTISDQFIIGAKEAGHVVEKVYLNKAKIRGCQACDACRHNGGQCIFKDDAGDIIQKIIDADAFVFASPVYFYSISAQLKLLIDRTYAREKEITNKKAYFIMSCAAPYEEPYKDFLNVPIETFRGYLKCLDNVEEGGIIIAASTAEIENIKDNPAYKQAYEMGLKV